MTSVIAHSTAPGRGHRVRRCATTPTCRRRDRRLLELPRATRAPPACAQPYPGATYERLVQVKRRVDPENVFHANHNIRPD